MSNEETPDADTTGQFAATPKAPLLDRQTLKLLLVIAGTVTTLFGGGFVAQSTGPSSDTAEISRKLSADSVEIKRQLSSIILTLDGDGRKKKGLSAKMDFLGQRQDAGYREARELQRLSGYESEMMEFRRRERRHKDRPTWDQVSNR